MTFWKAMKTVPLDSNYDVLAGIGVRCVCCTLPYLVVAYAMAACGSSRLLLSPWAAGMVAVPIAGGIVDAARLHRKQARQTAA